MSQKYTITLVAAVFLSVVLISSTSNHQNEQSLLGKFNDWKSEYSMTFNPTEEHYRFKVFMQNLKQIKTHNSKLDRTYDLGLNMFSHLTSEEFAAKYLTTAINERN